MRTGTIGVPSDETIRYAAFAVSLAATMERVSGWTTRFGFGRSVTKNCNHLVRAFEGDMLWFQADDHIWPSDSLERLEAHGKDVIVPLILMRQQPFVPVIFEGQNENGGYRIMQDIPDDEVFEVYAAGTGGMLVSRDALDAIGPDPFAFSRLESGEIVGEDLGLCERFRKAGIPIFCDPTVRMGHILTTVVWPDVQNDQWTVRLDFNSGAVAQ